MAPSKMPCKNNAAFSYSGKEMSPMGLGYCADAEMVNSEMVGRDGKTWVVGLKNGNRLWMRAPEPMLKKETPVLPVKDDVEPKANEDVEPKANEDVEPKANNHSDDMKDLPDLEESIETVDETLEDPFGWKPTEDANESDKEDEEEKSKEEVKPKENGEAKPKRKYTRKPKLVEGEIEEAKVKEEPKRKYTRKPKLVESEIVEPKENEDVKPKRKYTRKPKLVEGEIVVENEPKKERKPRKPTEYNEFIGKTMKELREKHKDNKDLKTTDYMKMALAEWQSHKIAKVAV